MGGVHNQWYLHYFAAEQPDFNWDNSEVEEDFLRTLKFWADRGVDGFRIDVAHGLKKDLSIPYRLRNTLEHEVDRPVDGNGILADRDEVFDVYRKWRKLFNQYDPPRVAVAEANVVPERMPLYASEETLGQCFDFTFLFTPYNSRAYRNNVEHALDLARKNKSSSTWCLSNHDQIRHATKFGLASDVDRRQWMLSDGSSAQLDKELGTKRALAATMFILSLPGSTYLYQGEELGLHEVTDIPESKIQDPQYLRNLKIDKGRDGCRVPLPWMTSAPSFGFSEGTPHLPQPKWFADFAVDNQIKSEKSPLNLYKRALKLRRELLCEEELIWHETGDPEVLHISRPNGWHCIMNFNGKPFLLPEGEVLLTSAPILDHHLESGTTAWLRLTR
jgi:alpha-glucosidase